MLFRIVLQQPVFYSILGANNIGFGNVTFRVCDNLRRAAYIVGKRQDSCFTFRMSQNFGFRMCSFQCNYLLRLNLRMDWTATVVQNDVFFRNLLRNEPAKVTVWYKENILVWKCLHNLYGIGGCDTHVALGLQFSGRVNVAHHCQILIFCPHFGYLSWLHHMSHRAVRS